MTERTLRRCRIPTLPGAALSMRSTPLAQLGPCTISHSHNYYWIASGFVPLGIAKILYADPLGKEDVRVAGHCGCPAPEYPWVEWYDLDGYLLIPQKEIDECDAFASRLAPFARNWAKDRLFIRPLEDAAEDGRLGFVTVYHIDSEAGLRFFADTLRQCGLDSPNFVGFRPRKAGVA